MSSIHGIVFYGHVAARKALEYRHQEAHDEVSPQQPRRLRVPVLAFGRMHLTRCHRPSYVRCN